MYTQCPECQTRFRVTATVLRAAHGTVRCGRCGSAFDALVRLSDSLEPPAPALEPVMISVPPLSFPSEIARALEEPSSEPTEVLVDETSNTETITLEGERVSVDIEPESIEPPGSGMPAEPGPGEEPPPEFELEDDLDATDRYEALEISESQFQEDRDAERELEALVQRLQREFGPDIVESAESLEHDEETAETEAIFEAATPELTPDGPMFVDIAPNGAVTSVPERWTASSMKPHVPEPVDPAADRPAAPSGLGLEPEPLAETIARLESSAERGEGFAAAAAEAGRTDELPLSARRFRPTSIDAEAEPGPDRSGWSTFAWSLGCLLLAAALAVQVIDHWRDAIARDARFGGLLRGAYERVGIDLPPSRDLASLQLEHLSVEDRDSGRMVVRASLTNRAGFAQPMPILRLQLEDRYGSMIAARDFEPSEYLASGASRDSMLKPGATSEAELVLADPGPEAVGYRLDVCLGGPEGQLLCAQTPGPG
jgi:predicted Zn finger-like uncharacterized protein